VKKTKKQTKKNKTLSALSVVSFGSFFFMSIKCNVLGFESMSYVICFVF